MDANLKLLKKRRVAHTGSKLPHMSCEEPKLLPDDFVYNIMKDMDKKKNVMSYQQLQEYKCQKRQDAPPDEDISGYQKSSHNKHAKKMLQKKTFPLMKKCQTSLKHLKKNRCIPKPRAHVGPVPRPQLKPILNLEKKSTKFQHISSSSTCKTKQSNSKSKNNISQSDFKVCKTSNFKSCVSKQTINQVKENAQVDQISSSDDDDAFEDFVQKANEKDSYSSDSDTDSRMIIHRKKSKTKLKQVNKKLRDFSENEVDRRFSKITSRPLSDSSECEKQEMFENVKNKRASFMKRKYSERESPIQLQENVPDEATYNSSLSEEDPQDLDSLNCDSSDSELNLKVPNSKSSTHIVDVSNINSNTCNSEPTNSVVKCNIPCYVRLIRDPEIDKRAMRFYSTTPILAPSNMFYSSNDDCIVISGNSDNEETQVEKLQMNPSASTSWSCDDTDPGEFDVCEIIPKQGLGSQSKESNLTHGSSSSRPPLSNTPNANVVVQIHNPDSINNLSNSKHHSIQVGLPASSKDSLSQQSLHTETDMDECVIVGEKSQPDALDKSSEIRGSSTSGTTTNPNLFSHATNQLPSTEHNEANTINNEMQDFNVKIVAVHSVTEVLEPSASESNDVEVIDLSDDDSHVPDIQGKSNSVKESIDVSDSLKTLDENVSAMKDHESNLSLSSEADPKILEILSKIDFECIKEIISKTKVENSENNSCKIGDSSTFSNVLPPGISMTMPTCEKDTVSKEINSTNRIEFQKQNSKNVTGNLHNTSDVSSKPSQIRNLNEFSNKLLDSQPLESLKNIAPKCSTGNTVKDFHASNQTLRKDPDKALLNDKNTNSLINVCPTEILVEDSHDILIKETESFKKIKSINPSSLENRTVTTGTLHIHSKKNSENVSDQFSETVKNCRVAVCQDVKVVEVITKGAAKSQQDSSSVFKTTTSNVTTNNKKKANVPELADKQCKIDKVRNEKSVQNHMPQPAKKEIVIESPSDELDVLATSYINDLNPSNTKVLSLLELYKREYEKYKQIKNTESNVSAGLKMLHENQVHKLKHIHASIKNLTKHDACFYKASQEDCCNNVKTIVKDEIADKVGVKKESENFQVLRHEGPLSEKGVQVATKLESSGPSRENMFRLMMNIKCAHCGKPATARCQGCAEVYYCSSQCGEQSWRQGHYAVCKKS